LLTYCNLFLSEYRKKFILPLMKLLLLVQTEADVAHLGAAAKGILNSAITGVWVVFSPAITVNSTEASAKFDTEIAQLAAAERQAADRSDYTAAAGYKTQRDGKELDRAKALRDAWKVASAEDRKAKTESTFAPFIELLRPKGINVRITGHSDHYEREQWVAMINSLSGVWFKPFTPGSFIVGWPESVETSVKAGWPEIVEKSIKSGKPTSEQIDQAQAAQRLPQVPKVTLSRAEELAGMKHFSRVAVAKKLGLTAEGKSKEDLIKEILDRESPPTTAAAPEAELASY
jgi:hypothetical protein